jgi:Winged helix DNA-binding domain
VTVRLGQRALNRTLLARQLLLRREQVPASDVIERLVGLQAQAPLAPYVGLWDRIEGFAVSDLSELLATRQAARTHLMRVTIHLVTARDCRALRPVMQPMIARQFARSTFARDLAGVDLFELAARAAELMTESPRTRPDLGRLLVERWPDRNEASLAAAAPHLSPASVMGPLVRQWHGARPGPSATLW